MCRNKSSPSDWRDKIRSWASHTKPRAGQHLISNCAGRLAASENSHVAQGQIAKFRKPWQPTAGISQLRAILKPWPTEVTDLSFPVTQGNSSGEGEDPPLPNQYSKVSNFWPQYTRHIQERVLTSLHPAIWLLWADSDLNYIQNSLWRVLALGHLGDFCKQPFVHPSAWSSLLVLWLRECQAQIKFIWDLSRNQRHRLCFPTNFTWII